ncbi:2-dehydropantoate 2-reductase [Streptosporangium sp. NBC_01639]|uniref:ketopantoate reductase family protein n=1 Tax=Streptosporangium sp. NBC_01639 TaxID=2975948 RepID=UPI0038634FCF|nr:2-dehydropantoate 2-reductase [Streptosporangium sp. NBC_01639]
MSRSYTVVGGGAIGGTIAFHLAGAGHPVLLVDTDAAHVAAVREKGLTIRRPDGTEQCRRVPARTPDEVAGPLHNVVLAVKANATTTAARWIAPRLAADGSVVSLQNGLCEPEIAAAVGSRRTVSAFVNLFADLVEPGVIADGGPGALVVGELDGTISTRVREFVADLQAWGPALASENVAGFLWSKLAYGVVAAASATVDDPIFDTIDRHPELTVALAREVYAIAAAQGITPESFDAWQADAFAVDTPPDRTRTALAEFCAWLRTQPKTKTGIWRDLAVRHRPTEVPAQYGPVLRLAAEHGLKCPGIETVLGLIGELETGRRSMSRENMAELERTVIHGGRETQCHDTY